VRSAPPGREVGAVREQAGHTVDVPGQDGGLRHGPESERQFAQLGQLRRLLGRPGRPPLPRPLGQDPGEDGGGPQAVQRERRDGAAQVGGRSATGLRGQQDADGRRVGQRAAVQQALQRRHRGQRGSGPAERAAERGQRPQPGRQQLVEPAAQRRRQSDEGQRRLERPAVHHEDVGVRTAQLREQRDLGRTGRRRHGRSRGQVHLGQDGGQCVDVRGPEAFDRGLRVHHRDGEARHRVEPGDRRPAARQQRRPLPGARGLHRRGGGQRGGSGPARAGHEECAHPAISPRRAS
jgi:hypothetical protein